MVVHGNTIISNLGAIKTIVVNFAPLKWNTFYHDIRKYSDEKIKVVCFFIVLREKSATPFVNFWKFYKKTVKNL